MKLLLKSKADGQSYTEEELQGMEAQTLKKAYLDLEERTPSTALHRSINQKFKRRTGAKELIKNLSGRHAHGQWVLLVSKSQVQLEDKNLQNTLANI